MTVLGAVLFPIVIFVLDGLSGETALWAAGSAPVGAVCGYVVNAYWENVGSDES